MGKKTELRKKRIFGWGNLNDTLEGGRKRFKSSEDLLEESVLFANSSAMKPRVNINTARIFRFSRIFIANIFEKRSDLDRGPKMYCLLK